MQHLIRRHGAFAVLIGAALALAVWLWGYGGSIQLTLWAADQQREVQGALAGALRAVRGGEVWAWGSLLGLCFAYGFFHAAGPGHGKLVMGGYALGEDVPRRRLVLLTLAGSLGQAFTAVLLVYTGVLVLGWTRSQMTDLADGTLAAFSAGAITLVGLWLLWRGLRRLRGSRATAHHSHHHDHHQHDHHDHHHHHDHDHHHHDHSHGEVCSECGHAHGPTAEQVASATDWRSALGVVLAVAIRPCTGALFVLILTYGMGIPLAGIAGAVIMGLGTALLTIGVALGAGALRGGLAERLSGTGGLRAMALVEITAGAMVALIASQMALRLI